jgi:tetratricopeptide (TPR) repeat protein
MWTKGARNWAVGVAGLLALAGCGPTLEQTRARDIAADGVSLFQHGRYREAREDFEFALQATPNDANLLFDVGRCHDRLGDRKQAEEYYQKCLAQNGKHAQCRQALALLWRETDRKQQAAEFVEDWLAREPELASAYALDGWRLRLDKQYQEATGRLQQALHHDPHDAMALTELGLLYEQLEHPERALALYERALQVSPHDPELTERVTALKKQGAGRPKPGL